MKYLNWDLEKEIKLFYQKWQAFKTCKCAGIYHYLKYVILTLLI